MNRLGRVGLAALVAVGLVGAIGLAVLLGSSSRSDAGPTCTKSWAAATSGAWDDGANWSPAGAPTATEDVCITVAGTYTVTVHGSQGAHSVQLGAGSSAGTSTLSVEGVGCSTASALAVTTTTDVSAHGELLLTSATCGGSTATFTAGGVLTNDGAIRIEPGAGGGRLLRGPVVNNGTTTIDTATTSDVAGNFDNRGMVTLTAPWTVTGSSGFVGRAGSVTSSGAGQLVVTGGATFTERSGTTSGANPVAVQNATLQVLGSGSPASFVLHQTATLSGNLAAGQRVAVEAVGCSFATSVTVAGDLTNAGRIDLTSSTCGGSTAILGGTGLLTNSGTLAIEPGVGGDRYVRMDVRNTGTTLVDAPANYDQSGTTFTNQGQVALTAQLQVLSATVTNTSGSVDATGAGSLLMSSGSQFREADGGTTGNPVTVLNGSLAFPGTSSATTSFVLHQNPTLSGDVPAGASIDIEAVGCSYATSASAGAFTNAGRIRLTSASCGGSTVVLTLSGLLTNTGRFEALTGTGGDRYLRGDVRNTGVLQISTPLTYDTAGSTLRNEGTISLTSTLTTGSATVQNAGGSIDASGNGLLSLQSSTFQQTGGSTSGNPVEIRNSTLTFPGSASPTTHFVLHQGVALSGDVPAGATLDIEAVGCSYATTVTAAGAFTNAGTIRETSSTCGGSTVVLTGPGLITNRGTIDIDAGTGGDRYLRASVRNLGTLSVDAPLTYDTSGSTLTNEGTIVLTATMTTSGAAVEDRSGSITATAPALLSVNSGAFVQGAGRTAGSPVEVRNSSLTFSPPASDSAHFTLHQNVTLAGDVPTGTVLDIEAVGCSYATAATTSGSFTNAGTITLGSTICGGSTVTLGGPGTLTNTGTISVDAGTGGARGIETDVRNIGTVVVDAPLSFDKAGSTFTNDGTVTLTQPMTASSATVANDGGSIDATAPGLLSVQSGTYEQGQGATSGPPVEVRNSTLTYTTPAGPGSSVVVHQSVTLDGDVPGGAKVVVESVGCSYATTLTAPGGFTNAGDLTLTSASCGGSTTTVTSDGPIVNTGTMTSSPGVGGARQITTPSLVDDGTLVLQSGVTLGLTGDLTIGSSGTLLVGVDGPGVNGRIAVTGSVDFGGSLATATTYVPPTGTTFDVATYGSATGQFADTGTSGTQYTADYQPTTLVIAVLKASAATVVATPAGTTVTGEAVTFMAMIGVVPPDMGTPTGQVDLLDGVDVIGTATLDGAGHASFTTSDLLVGAHDISVEYLGNGTLGHASSSALVHHVDKASTTLGLTSGPSPSTPGQTVTLTATVAVVAPGTGVPPNDVTFREGSTVLGTRALDGGGVATLEVSDLHVGTHSITAAYSGSTRYGVATSPSVDQVVEGVAVGTITAVSAPTGLVATEPFSLTAVVAPVPPATDPLVGDVEFRADGVAIGTAPVQSSGMATLRLPGGFTAGTHPVVAAYLGTETLDPSTSAAHDVAVGQATATITVTPVVDQQHRGQLRFTLVATAVAPASSLPQGPIELRDGDEVVAEGTLDGGRAELVHCFTPACAPPVTTTTTTTTTTTPPTTSTSTTEPATTSSTAPPTTTTTGAPTSTSTTTTVVPASTTSEPTTSTTFDGPRVGVLTATVHPTTTAPATPARPIVVGSRIGLDAPAAEAGTVHQLVASYDGDGNFASYRSPAIPVNVDGDDVSIGEVVPPTTTPVTDPPTTTPVTVPPTTPGTVLPTTPGTTPVTTAGGGSGEGPIRTGSDVGSIGAGGGTDAGASAGGSGDPTDPGVAGRPATGGDDLGAPAITPNPGVGITPSLGERAGSASSGDLGTGRAAATGGDPNRQPTAVAAQLGRTTLARNVADPHRVRTDPGFVLGNIALTLVLVLLIAFPAHMFNNTLAENYDEVLGWFGPIQRRFEGARRMRGKVPTPVVLGLMSIGGAVLFAFLDPDFGFNRASLALVLGLLSALVIVSSVYDVARARYLRKHFGVISSVRGYPAGMAVAVVLVAFSRIAHFTPGYLFGVFTALGFNQEVDEREDGKGLAVAAASLLGVAVLCWLLWMPVSAAAVHPSPPFTVLFLDAALSTIWIAGIQGLVFGMLPLRFLDGLKVLHWSRVGWGVLYGIGMFAFVHTMLRPGLGNRQHKSFLPALAVFLGFTVLSLLFWAYFRFRTVPPSTQDDGPGEPPPGSAEQPVLVDA